MMMPEMIKAAAMMAAVMKTTMVMVAAIEGADGEDGKSAEVKSALPSRSAQRRRRQKSEALVVGR